jgi:hypothetical protein
MLLNLLVGCHGRTANKKMKLLEKRGTLTLAGLVCSALLAIACVARAQQKAPPRPSDTEGSIKQFLKEFDKRFDDDKTTRYVLALQDLNGDEVPEGLVYLMGNEWCGSGGCTTLILQRNGSAWRIVRKILITRPPIYLFADTSHGWHNIGVWVQGGGIQPGYEAELRFDGTAYPSNPSMPPARRLAKIPPGELVIASMNEAVPLYDK